MKLPVTINGNEYSIPEKYLRTVVCWAGSAKETAGLLGVEPRAIYDQIHKHPEMREMIAHRYMMTAEMAVDGMDGAIAKRDELMQFWTRVIYDPNTAMRDKLAASINLAKVYGMFTEKLEITEKAEEEVVQPSVAERMAMVEEIIAREVPAAADPPAVPTGDWAQ